MNKNDLIIDFIKDDDADSCIDACMDGYFYLKYKGKLIASDYGNDFFLENIKKSIINKDIKYLLENKRIIKNRRKGQEHSNEYFWKIKEEREYESSYGYGSLERREKSIAENDLKEYLNKINQIDN